jgi:hypothetical protein
MVRFEQPETRRGRAAVAVLVVAIFAATALAIALVLGAASAGSTSSDGLDVRFGTAGVLRLAFARLGPAISAIGG